MILKARVMIPYRKNKALSLSLFALRTALFIHREIKQPEAAIQSPRETDRFDRGKRAKMKECQGDTRVSQHSIYRTRLSIVRRY